MGEEVSGRRPRGLAVTCNASPAWPEKADAKAQTAPPRRSHPRPRDRTASGSHCERPGLRGGFSVQTIDVRCTPEKRRQLPLDPFLRHPGVRRLDLDPDGVSAAAGGSQEGRPCAHEGIKDGIASEGKHPYETIRQLLRKRRWMAPCGFSREALPYLLEPLMVLLLCKPGRFPLLAGRLAVPARLPQHQDELDVVLDDGIGLVGLPQEAGPVPGLMACIRDLVPEDRRQVVEADLPRPHDDVGVHWHHRMPAMLAPRQANVPDDAHEPAAGNQHAKAMLPHLVELAMKGVIAFDEPQLALAMGVFLERPVRGRGQGQVD